MHERTRLTQSQILARQSILLDRLVAGPVDATEADSLVGAVRRRRAEGPTQGVVERFKERWNREVESGVRRVYDVDWRGVREGLEERVAGVWGKAMEGTREIGKSA